MGSLHALELVAGARFWKHWLEEPLGSADTVGRVHALLDAGTLRQGIHRLYDRLKRNKALPDRRGVAVAVLDGRESHAGYLRHCPACLQRTVHFEEADRAQFHHRQVTVMLLPGAPPGREPVRLLLDQEPQRAGEDEVATAARLLDRVIGAYPRAFDLLPADALYGIAPQEGSCRSRQCRWWEDFPDLLSWPQVSAPARVLRSLETRSARRRIDRQDSPQTSDWIWVTTLPPTQVPTERAIRLGRTQAFWASLIAAELYAEVIPSSLSP